MKATIVFASLGLAISSVSIAHEGHNHGLSKEETIRQMKEGKLCVVDEQGNSEGAVIQKDDKIYRCVKAYGKNLEAKTELVWVELTLKDKALVTLP